MYFNLKNRKESTMNNSKSVGKNCTKSKCIAFLVLFMLISSFLTANEWISIGPTTQDLHVITWHPENENEIFGAFENTIYKSNDHLESWYVLYVFDFEWSGNAHIADIKFDPFDSNIIYVAVGMYSVNLLPGEGLYKSTDGGVTFTQILANRTLGIDIHPLTGKIINYSFRWDFANIDLSDDGGLTWNSLNSYPENFNQIVFDSVDDNILYCTTWNGMYKSVDSGEYWQLIGLSDLSLDMCVVHPDNSGELWVGARGFSDFSLYHTINGGETWTLVDIPQVPIIMDNPIKLVYGNDRNVIYIGEVNEIFVSQDGGQTWSVNLFNEDFYFYTRDMTINPFNDGEVLAISDGGFIRTTNYGATWETTTLNFGASLTIESAVNPDGGYYIYSGGPHGNRRYSSLTEEWVDFSQQHMAGLEVRTLAVDNTVSDMLLTGYHTFNLCGVIRKSTDAGETDTVVYNNIPYESGFMTMIIKSPAEQGVFYGTTWSHFAPGQFIRSEDWGDTWEIIERYGATHLNYSGVQVSYSNPDIIYTIGDEGVFKSENRAFSFLPKNYGLGNVYTRALAISPYDDNYLLVSTNNGLYKSTDGAESWQMINTTIMNILKFHPYIPGLIYAISYDNEVLMSKDFGNTWFNDTDNIPHSGLTGLTFTPDGQEVFVSTWNVGIFKKQLQLDYMIPDNLSLTSSGFNVMLSWEEVNGAEKYAIYRDGQKIGESNTNAYNDYYLLPGQYSYRVKTLISSYESDLSGPVFAYIGGSDLTPPSAFNAQKTSHRDVVLSWNEPVVEVATDWLGYDDGESDGYFSPFMGGDFQIAIMFDSEDLEPYEGYLLSKIKFITAGEGAEYTLRVWSGLNGENLVMEQEITDFVEYDWNEFTLNNPIVIDSSEPLYVGFLRSGFGAVASFDSGPAIHTGKSNLIRSGAATQWNTLDNFGFDGINANWNLRALVETNDLLVRRTNLQNFVNDAHTGYRVYRNGSPVQTINNIETMSYSDLGLNFNEYHYAVTAIYQNGESVPSNSRRVVLENPFIAPSNLSYTMDQYFNVDLQWSSPVFPELPQEVSLLYGNGNQAGTFSPFMGGNMQVAVRYSASDLAAYEGMTLNSISFKPVNMNGSYTLKVWSGNNAQEIYSQEIEDFNHNVINEFILGEEILITPNTDLWFGFELNHMGGDTFAYDNANLVSNGYSNLIKFGFGDWSTILNEMDISGNHIIYAKLNAGDNVIENPVVIGYKVYKDDELLETINNPEILSFTDSGLNFETEYAYKVTALYEDDEESSYSNTLVIMIASPYVAPEFLTGDVVDRDVQLNWEMPEDKYALRWDVDNYRIALGAGTESLMSAVRFSSVHLADVDGFELRRVSFFARESYNTTIKIYSGFNGENLLHSQNVGWPDVWSWNEYILDEAIVIDSSDALMIAIEMTGLVIGAMPIIMDGGPAVTAYGDLASLDGGETWDVLSHLGYNGNQLIRGEVVDTYGNSVRMSLDRDNVIPVEVINNQNESRYFGEVLRNTIVELTGFKVYRNDEFLTFIPNDNTRYFTDENLENGVYSYRVSAVYTNEIESDLSNTIQLTVDFTNVDELMPLVTSLNGNYPNPFNPETKISFSLHQEQKVSIEIYNIKGQKVKTLVNGVLPAKNHTVVWRGENQQGQSVASGVYFYKMKTDNYTSVKRMLMLK